MRLAFSTLGCSGWPLTEVAALAKESGWTGLELRAAADEPVHTGLSAAGRAQARRDLDGTTILCVASYVKVAADGDDDRCVADLLAHAALAADLGAPAVRVFPGAAEAGPAADDRAVRRLAAAAPLLPDGVRLWLETHDSHPRGVDVARILAAVGHPGVGAIWDVLHPWRTGEAMTVTAAALAPFLAHVQVKDVKSAAERTPLALGAGTVPLTTALDLVRRLGYDGWLSLEWESKWYADAGPLPQALADSRRWLDKAAA
ncbi:sugar phosphate isomerase/epimerase family protein [Hamadaea tsunoensis]|uniref:sugar phosphate isomerase/epimerase family protein n=1 Tax=Hamadaea tsunoensis TaxID=53368 RepID=UPI0004257A50|nr:TIM barrel protein [Hamadaea tsunoensis]